MRRVSIFGATGSIGQNTVDLISRDPEAYRVVALTGGRNIARLAADSRRLKAELAVTAFPEALPDLRAALASGDGVFHRAESPVRRLTIGASRDATGAKFLRP